MNLQVDRGLMKRGAFGRSERFGVSSSEEIDPPPRVHGVDL